MQGVNISCINLMWEEPSEQNGVIVKYQVVKCHAGHEVHCCALTSLRPQTVASGASPDLRA